MTYVKGRAECLSDGIIVNMLELRLLMGKVVLSVRSGGGDTLTRWLNDVRRKINGINGEYSGHNQSL